MIVDVDGVLRLGTAAVMIAYPLTEKAFREMVAEVAERRVRARVNVTVAETRSDAT